MTARETTHGFLPIAGVRVFVTGTRHHGFRGTVLDSTPDMSPRGIRVQLDEWHNPIVLYNHNIIPLFEETIRSS